MSERNLNLGNRFFIPSDRRRVLKKPLLGLPSAAQIAFSHSTVFTLISHKRKRFTNGIFWTCSRIQCQTMLPLFPSFPFRLEYRHTRLLKWSVFPHFEACLPTARCSCPSLFLLQHFTLTMRALSFSINADPILFITIDCLLCFKDCDCCCFLFLISTICPSLRSDRKWISFLFWDHLIP